LPRPDDAREALTTEGSITSGEPPDSLDTHVELRYRDAPDI